VNCDLVREEGGEKKQEEGEGVGRQGRKEEEEEGGGRGGGGRREGEEEAQMRWIGLAVACRR